MDYEELEKLFWKKKLQERYSQPGWGWKFTTEVTEDLAKGNFEVISVSFDEGAGEVRYSEYTSDYDYDSYRIHFKSPNSKNLCEVWSLDNRGEFAQLVAEIAMFGVEVAKEK